MKRSTTGAQETAPLPFSGDKELKRARNSAYRYLAIRPRSRAEVEKRLRERDFAPDIVSAVVDHLLRLGYLNDEEFARQWASSRMRSRGFGRRRIEQELRQRGVERETVAAALEGLFEERSEIDLARREAEKKLRTLARFLPEVRRRRLAGFLERKGFPSGVIHAILGTLE